MRVLVATSPWPTHYFIVQPLAAAFRAAGHEVLVVAQPSMADLVTRSGLPMAAVGIDIDMVEIRRKTLSQELKARQKPEDPDRADDGGQVFDQWQRAALANLDPVMDLARAWKPDLVLADTMCPPGLVAAQELGVPGIRHLWGWDFFGSAGSEQILASLPGFYEPYRAYGLDVQGDPALRTVDPCPPSLQPPPSPARLQVQYVPYNGAGLAPGPQLRRGGKSRARICLTWGRSISRIIGERAFLLPRIIRALDGLDIEIVVAIDASSRDQLGDLPGNVRVLDSPPLHLVLDDCDAIVHQGGSGTVFNAIRAGLGQLAISHMADQDNISAALAGSGAGIHLSGEQADEQAIRAAVIRLLEDPEVRTAADRLRAEMLSQPTPAQVAAGLAELATTYTHN
ncbi:mithramycin biosynthesis glycosyltransferase MtmGIII [Streptomyces sp. NRRL F-5630]|uniref:mithramycin biosynthesis glycosyltransferase MtmGIII n=1 Tax=Streptomyces sp. NRRL F-5630 TaxID=1463864 RepID=UPI0004C5D5D2|nr:mithramycin biosynthesis glycosyltransferase MtmGIII [Streptomyces sp. NRRL F-5630]